MVNKVNTKVCFNVHRQEDNEIFADKHTLSFRLIFSSALLPKEAYITGLQAETSYSVTLAAYTTKGDGARSKAKVVTTTGAGKGVLVWHVRWKLYIYDIYDDGYINK